MKRIECLVWGSVTTNGKKFYLLEPKPETSVFWMLEGMYKWEVCNAEDYKLTRLGEEAEFVPVYNASHIIFGKDAVIELLDNPETSIFVNYFDTEEVIGNPI